MVSEEITEESQLVEQQKSWTRMDKILLVFGALMSFAQGVEMYLPGKSKDEI